MILVAGVLGMIMLYREKDYAYAIVLIWATVGILVKFMFASRAVGFAATFVAILLTVFSVAIYLEDRRKINSKKK